MILEILGTKAIVISYEYILVNVPFHVILKEYFKHVAVVVQVVFDICDELRPVFGRSEEDNGSTFVVLADVFEDLE